MSKRRLQKGLTLIELLLGMVMATIIFVVVASLMVSLMGSNLESRVEQILEQTKNDLQTEFINYVRWADTITTNPGELTVNGANYRLMPDERIHKNGNPITSNSVEIKNFDVQRHADGSLEITVDMQHEGKSDIKDVLRVVISPRNRLP
jgi:type II secretory pathway pseudopilin PulG